MKKKSPISLIIIMLSLALFCSYHIYYYFLDKGSDELVKTYYNEFNNEKIPTKIKNEVKEDYLGILKIPKIKLEEGFYHIDSKKNNINHAVTILKESTMPKNDGSIIYLVAHSGSGYLAFFKDLDKLNLNDIIYVDINGNSYQYIVSDLYEIEKTGKIMVDHNIHENILVLSTCSKNNKQLVVISKLVYVSKK